MKYMGSKKRVAQYILPIMLDERLPDQYWVEPFVGGGNIIDKVVGKRIGSDINPYVIDALISIRDFVSELPKNNTEFTENDYKKLRKNNDYKHKGYAGFAFSYSGKWLGGWCRDNDGHRDYVNEAYKNALSQSPLLQDVVLLNTDYACLPIPDNSIIYCDPPYKGVTKYTNGLNYDVFWQWCRDMAKNGHTIFISEYTAPEDFDCIWSMEICSSLTKQTGAKKSVEKLFRPKRY